MFEFCAHDGTSNLRQVIKQKKSSLELKHTVEIRSTMKSSKVSFVDAESFFKRHTSVPQKPFIRIFLEIDFPCTQLSNRRASFYC